MLSKPLEDMNGRSPYDNDSKKTGNDHKELHSSPSKLPGNSRESEKENPLHPFSNRDYVACRFLAGTDPITRRKVEEKQRP